MKSERSNNRRDFSFVKVRQPANGWRDPQKLVIRRHNLREGSLLQQDFRNQNSIRILGSAPG
jgi:hypothetical protein